MQKIGALFLALLIFCEICYAQDSGSGKCGDNVFYAYDRSSGLLSISGIGNMWDYNKSEGKPDSNHPWYVVGVPQPRNFLKRIEVRDGVTSIGRFAFFEFEWTPSIKLPTNLSYIGEQAFFKCKAVESLTIPYGVEVLESMSIYMCNSMTSLALPGTLKRIEELALSWCTALTTIHLPEGLTYIGNQAFDACEKLVALDLPESLVEIGDKAFNRLHMIPSITIPKNVEKIGDAVFARNNLLLFIGVHPDNEYFTSVDGVLFNKDETELVAYPPNKPGDSYTISSNVTSIRNGAFGYAKNIEKVVIPSSVTMVEDKAFEKCSLLTEVEYYGLFDCGTEAFSGSNGVATVHVPMDYQGDYFCNIPVTKDLVVGVSWFLNETTGLMIIYGQGSMDDYASPEDAPWYKKKSLIKVIEVWSGVESIGDNAFTECGNLTAMFVASSVVKIGAHAFEKCDNLMFVSYDGKQNPCGEGEGAFDNCDALDLFCVPLDYENEKFCDSTYIVKADSCTSPSLPATTPYHVASMDDYMMLELYAMNGLLTFDVSLDMDMDFSTLRLSLPLGVNYAHQCTAYSGTLEGNSHVVTNLVMNNTKEFHYGGSALFCSLQAATIKDLSFSSSCEFTGIKAAALSLEASDNVLVKNVINNARVSGVDSAAGFVGALVDDTTVFTVNNSANKGSVTATSGKACGVFCMDANSTVYAFNIIGMGEVNGDSDSTSFALWEKSAASTFTEMSVFGLESVCKNCDSFVNVFSKDKASQLFFTKTGDERVDSLMNKFSNDNEMVLFWSRELEFTDVFNVKVTGEIVLDDKYKYGTILDEITELHPFLNNSEYAIADKHTDVIYTWSTIITMDMDIVVSPVSSSASSSVASSAASSGARSSSASSSSSSTQSSSSSSDSKAFSHEIKVNCTPLKPDDFNDDEALNDICTAAGVRPEDVILWDKRYDKDGNIIGFGLLCRDEVTRRKIEEVLRMCYELNEKKAGGTSSGSRVGHLAAFFVVVVAALVSVITF